MARLARVVRFVTIELGISDMAGSLSSTNKSGVDSILRVRVASPHFFTALRLLRSLWGPADPSLNPGPFGDHYDMYNAC